MYLLLSTFPLVWNRLYKQTVALGSLNYLSLTVGYSLGTLICAAFQDKIYASLKARSSTPATGRPEFRIPIMIPGSLFISMGLFLYGWSAHYELHWIVPNIGAMFTGIGSIICYQAIQSFLIDAYTQYAASALGAATVLRSCAGFAFPLFAPALYQRLGLGWGNSLLGFAALAIGMPAPVLLWLYGEKLRARSPFAAG